MTPELEAELKRLARVLEVRYPTSLLGAQVEVESILHRVVSIVAEEAARIAESGIGGVGMLYAEARRHAASEIRRELKGEK